ncbi:MAG: hypothetical protein Q8R30_02045 [bacterium]|nr:hypothetical protein [bacterium]MDZ4285566.1 hypothetical protein [Candidatus Sungbacteria bacterium]
MSVIDIGANAGGQFEKATLKLHCVCCGDTMFVMDAGVHICIGCNTRQEIMVRFGDREGFEQFEGDILPEEIHIMVRSPDIGTNLLSEVAEEFKKMKR